MNPEFEFHTLSQWKPQVTDYTNIWSIKHYQQPYINKNPQYQLPRLCLQIDIEQKWKNYYQWRIQSHNDLRSKKREMEASLSVFCMDQHGYLIAASYHNDTLRIWNTKGKLIRNKKQLMDSALCIKFSQSGQSLALGCGRQGVQIINDKQQALQLERVYNAYATSICYSPDDIQIAIMFLDDSIYIFDSITGLIVSKLFHQRYTHPKLIYSSDGQSVIVCSYACISKFDPKPGQLISSIKINFNLRQNTTAISPNGIYFCFGSRLEEPKGGLMSIWNIESGELFRQFLLTQQPQINNINFSPDSQFIVSTNQQKIITIINIFIGN